MQKISNTERLIENLKAAERAGIAEVHFMVGRYTGNGPAVIPALQRRGFTVKRDGSGYTLTRPKPSENEQSVMPADGNTNTAKPIDNTAKDKPMKVRDAYQSSNSFAVYGCYCFRMEEPLPESDYTNQVAYVRLSRICMTPVKTIAEALAAMRHHMHLAQIVEGWSPRDYQCGGYGFVANQEGQIQFWITPGGQVRKITYLGLFYGDVVDTPAHISMFDPKHDARDEGEYLTFGQSDSFARSHKAGAPIPADQQLKC